MGGDKQEWKQGQIYKEMAPPSTQNLKALGLWVFFLIYCSTFSFILNVGLRLTLRYLTISPSSESPFHIDTLSLERKQFQTWVPYSQTILTCIAVYILKRDTLAWNHRQKYFRCRDRYQTILAQAANHRLWYYLLEKSKGETLGRSHKNETRANPYKGMTPPSTPNLKALGLWVFFLICYSTFSFPLNMRFRLTLRYLTISPSSESPFFTLVHSPSSRSKRLLTCTTVHTLILDTLAWNLHQEDFDTGSPKPHTNDFITTCWENPREKHRGDQTRMRTRPNI